MLERCAAQLSVPSWQNWTLNLQRLFGERHLDPHGGLGFTAARIQELTAGKLEIGRSASTSTTATGSSGRSGTAPSFVSALSDT